MVMWFNPKYMLLIRWIDKNRFKFEGLVCYTYIHLRRHKISGPLVVDDPISRILKQGTNDATNSLFCLHDNPGLNALALGAANSTCLLLNG